MTDMQPSSSRPSSLPGFSIAAIVLETPEVLRRWCGYHFALGAERAYLYHDGPEEGADPGLRAMAAGFGDRVVLTFCDEAFWRDGGAFEARPSGYMQRQLHVLKRAHEANASDWLLLSDPDEYIVTGGALPGAWLAALPPGVHSAMVPPAEAIWGPEDRISDPFGASWFRRPQVADRRSLLVSLAVYGPLGVFFEHGMLSHVKGKQFLRRGIRFSLIQPHFADIEGKRVSRYFADLPGMPGGRIELLHYESGGYVRWRDKYLGRLSDPRESMRYLPRRRQVHIYVTGWAIRAGLGRVVYRMLYGANRLQLAIMRRRGWVFRARPFDQPPTTAR